jgi:hypothetical protein
VSDLPAEDVVASFDSATVLHAGLAAALRGERFPNLGHGPLTALAVRTAGRLPWPVLRQIYIRIGASEGLDPARLGDVDLSSVARWLADAYPRRPYPAVLVGSSNGALAHLAAAMQVPWLPGTVLVPVARTGDPDRPVDALRFGERVAAPLLARNPDVVLHHMHDQVQDELMVARMTYFRAKWRELPPAYARFLGAQLAPGAPVVLVQDRSTWPVVTVAERHVFQVGAQGGLDPEAYLARPHTPRADAEAAEAEWGAEAGLRSSVAAWCAANGHPLVRLSYQGPQAPAHAVAAALRCWYTRRGEAADRLLVPSFVLTDPWAAIATGTVPFWTFFSVQAAVRALEAHLEASDSYRHVDVLLFQHGVDSAGIARPGEWLDVVRRHGARGRLLALDARRFPHDIATLGRYGAALASLPPARHPWSPLDVGAALTDLQHCGVDVGAG